METRPRIKLNLSPLDRKLELTAKVFLVILWGLTLYVYWRSPEIIPTHFNASGNVDDHGSKAMLIILPVIATVIYFGLTQLSKYPHIFNYPVKITEENAERQYTNATRTLRFLKLAVLLIFSLIVFYTYLSTIGVTNGLGFWFLPVMEGFLLIPVVVALTRAFKK